MYTMEQGGLDAEARGFTGLSLGSPKPNVENHDNSVYTK